MKTYTKMNRAFIYNRVHVYCGTAVVYSLVCHLLPIPAEGAVGECRWLSAAQRLPEIAIEETEAPQTLNELSINA